MLRSKTHRQQLAEGHHLDELSFAHDRFDLGFRCLAREIGTDHENRGGECAELANELAADAAGRDGGLRDVAERSQDELLICYGKSSRKRKTPYLETAIARNFWTPSLCEGNTSPKGPGVMSEPELTTALVNAVLSAQIPAPAVESKSKIKL